MSDVVISNASNAPPLRIPSQSEILYAALRGWKLIIIGTLIGISWAASDLRSTPIRYTIEMEVTQAQQPSGGGGLPAGISADLASLALPVVQNGSEFRLYLDSLISHDIAEELVKDKDLMHRLFPEGWDDASQTWIDQPVAPTTIQAMTNTFYSWLGYPTVPWHAPDAEALLGVLGYYVKIQQDPKRPYIAAITMQYPDPKLAVEIMNKLHKTADDALRQRAIRRTTDYIAFLNKTLAGVTVAEHRAALATALSEQEKAAMMAHSGSAYAADLFEAPWASRTPTYPKPFQWLVIGAGIGGAAGAAAAVALWTTTNKRRAVWNRIRQLRRAAA